MMSHKDGLRPAGAGRLALAAVVSLGLGACERTLQVRGNMPDPEVIAQITPGVDNRDGVVDKLGSPSTISTFLDDRWYYIGHKTEQFAFLEPDVLERSVLVVSFNPDGMVDDTVLYTVEDGRIVAPVDRVTPTEGREITILQQLFGNIGRFPTRADTTPGF